MKNWNSYREFIRQNDYKKFMEQNDYRKWIEENGRNQKSIYNMYKHARSQSLKYGDKKGGY